MRPIQGRATSGVGGSIRDTLNRAWARLARRGVAARRIAGPKRARPDSRPKRPAAGFAERWERGEAPTRLALIACLVFLGASAAYAARLGGHLPTVGEATHAAVNGAARAAGLGIDEVRVIGAARMSGEEVVMRLGVDQTTSLLAFDADAGRRALLDVPWVKSVAIRKLYPSTLEVTMQEREPFALWQRSGQVSLIDREGRVIGPYDDRRFSTLPMVVGEGADQRAAEIVALLERHQAIRSRVRAAILVAERRWTLKLIDGVDVKLPEDDPARAVALLERLDRDNGVLNRDIAAVDFTQADRVTVRLTQAAAQRRNEQIRVRPAPHARQPLPQAAPAVAPAGPVPMPPARPI